MNALYLRDGRIVFPAANIGVVLNPKTNRQDFFCGHDAEITALALHPNKTYVATGQVCY